MCEKREKKINLFKLKYYFKEFNKKYVIFKRIFLLFFSRALVKICFIIFFSYICTRIINANEDTIKFAFEMELNNK